jgi:hypothetical protein
MRKSLMFASLLLATHVAFAAQPAYILPSGPMAAPPSTPAKPVPAPPLALVTSNIPPSEPLLPFGDYQDWILFAPLTYTIGATHDTITVPAGFVTDLASIPQALWSIGLRPEGQFSRAAIIHDYLYWSQHCTREQADHLLLIAMKESDVGMIQEELIYAAVHTAGGSAWDNNAKERKAGLVRTLDSDHRNPGDPNMIWSVYRSQLFKDGVKEVADSPDSSYCHNGDSSDVPKAR